MYKKHPTDFVIVFLITLKGMISLEYINVQMMDLKSTKIKETVTSNEDGSYTIFLNSRFTQEQLNDAYIHAMGHIDRDDFNKGSADVIEAYAHGLYKY